MNITFLIGNGFDVNLGLATRYTDFYPTYIKANEHLPDDNCIKKFCMQIDKDYKNWSDFEYAFSQFATGTYTEIGKILADFDNRFASHLKAECEKCEYDFPVITPILQKFLLYPYKHLPLADQQEMTAFYKTHERESTYFNFVSLNYTDTLDHLLGPEFKKGFPAGNIISNTKYNYYLQPVLHLHGSLAEGYTIVGIDSLDQFQDESLRTNPRVARHCVKQTINAQNGFQAKEEQFANTIATSNVICTYGISLGETDRSRWVLLKDWLEASSSHKLIIFKYNSGFPELDGMSKGPLLDAIDATRDEYLRLLGFEEDVFESMYSQIYVADSAGVLDFKLVEDAASLAAATVVK